MDLFVFLEYAFYIAMALYFIKRDLIINYIFKSFS